MKTIDCGPVECWSLAINDAENLVATGSHSGNLNVYSNIEDASLKGRSIIASLPTAQSFLMAVGFSKAADILAGGNRDGSIFWFSFDNSKTGSDLANSFKLLGHKKCHEKSLREIVFSKDGIHLISAADDLVVKVTDVKSRNEVSAFHGHRSWVMAVSPSPDGKTICSGSLDKTVKLFDIKTGKILEALETHSDQVSQVKFNEKGNQILSVGCDGDIFLYNYQV